MVIDIRMGIYQHYKGPLYQVLGLAHDADDPLRDAVVYISLELDGAHTGPRLAVRTLERFLEIVCSQSGARLVDCAARRGAADLAKTCDPRPRFTYVGPVLTDDMITHRSLNERIAEWQPRSA